MRSTVEAVATCFALERQDPEAADMLRARVCDKEKFAEEVSKLVRTACKDAQQTAILSRYLQAKMLSRYVRQRLDPNVKFREGTEEAGRHAAKLLSKAMQGGDQK